MGDGVARSGEPGWYLAVQGEGASVAIMIGGSLLVLYWSLVRTHATFAAVLGAVLGALVGVELGRLEARYLIEGLRASGTVTRTWKDPNPAGALVTVISALLVIVAGYATQSGLPGYVDIVIGSAAFFLFQASLSSAVAIVALWGFEQSVGQRVKERMTGSAFEYTITVGPDP